MIDKSLSGTRVRYLGTQSPPGPLALGTIIGEHAGRPGFRPQNFWDVNFGRRGSWPVPDEQLVAEDVFQGTLEKYLGPDDKTFLLEVLAAHDSGLSPEPTFPSTRPKDIGAILADQRRMASIFDALRGSLGA